jgi:uncharacterized protein involved in cysteine biosynthesis
MNDLTKGFGYLREGLRLLRTPGLKRYVAISMPAITGWRS